MHAIPTTYSGVQFRSRLEARWAAFFDLLKIKWLYEPFDLAGYIPDFILPEFGDLLVEVKPILHMSESGPAMDKIRASGWTKIEGRTGSGLGYDRHAVVVGACLWIDRHNHITLLDNSVDGQCLELDCYLYISKCDCHEEDQWTISSNGFCYKRSHWRPERDTEILCTSGANVKDIMRYWNLAGNRTQWNSPVKRR